MSVPPVHACPDMHCRGEYCAG